MSAHNGPNLLLVLNVLLCIFNSLHSVSMIEYGTSHAVLFTNNALNIIKIILRNFKDDATLFYLIVARYSQK